MQNHSVPCKPGSKTQRFSVWLKPIDRYGPRSCSRMHAVWYAVLWETSGLLHRNNFWYPANQLFSVLLAQLRLPALASQDPLFCPLWQSAGASFFSLLLQSGTCISGSPLLYSLLLPCLLSGDCCFSAWWPRKRLWGFVSWWSQHQLHEVLKAIMLDGCERPTTACSGFAVSSGSLQRNWQVKAKWLKFGECGVSKCMHTSCLNGYTLLRHDREWAQTLWSKMVTPAVLRFIPFSVEYKVSVVSRCFLMIRSREDSWSTSE